MVVQPAAPTKQGFIWREVSSTALPTATITPAPDTAVQDVSLFDELPVYPAAQNQGQVAVDEVDDVHDAFEGKVLAHVFRNWPSFE